MKSILSILNEHFAVQKKIKVDKNLSNGHDTSNSCNLLRLGAFYKYYFLVIVKLISSILV